MDEDFYNEMSDTSVEGSYEDVRPAYADAIQPYMFESTIWFPTRPLSTSASKEAV